MTPMKMFSRDPAAFGLMSTDALVEVWEYTNMPHLHQCWFCRGLDGNRRPFHTSPSCEYLAVKWADVVPITQAILSSPPLQWNGHTDPVQVLALATQLDSELGAAAASLINDAIELKTTGHGLRIVDNGRHRVAAMADQGISSPIPFYDLDR